MSPVLFIIHSHPPCIRTDCTDSVRNPVLWQAPCFTPNTVSHYSGYYNINLIMETLDIIYIYISYSCQIWQFKTKNTYSSHKTKNIHVNSWRRRRICLDPQASIACIWAMRDTICAACNRRRWEWTFGSVVEESTLGRWSWRKERNFGQSRRRQHLLLIIRMEESHCMI